MESSERAERAEAERDQIAARYQSLSVRIPFLSKQQQQYVSVDKRGLGSKGG